LSARERQRAGRSQIIPGPGAWTKKDYRKYGKTIVKFLSYQQPAFAGSRPDLFFAISRRPGGLSPAPVGGVKLAGRESLPQQKFTSHVGFFRFYVHQKHNPFKFVSFSYHFRCTFCIYYLIRLHHKELLIILARFHDRAFCICEVVMLREGYKLILVDRIFKDTIIRVFSRVTASA